MATKRKLASWTLWINLVVAIAAEVFKQLDMIMPETAWIAQGLNVTNMALRFKTTKPIL